MNLPAQHFPPRSVFLRCLAVFIFTGLAIALVLLSSRVSGVTEPGVNLILPDHVGNYLGFDDAITEAERRILPPDTEFAKKRYIGPGVIPVTCEIVLGGSQRNSIHRPQACLTGQGWTIQRDEPWQISLTQGGSQQIRVLTLNRTEGAKRITAYFLYWFVGHNRTTADHVERVWLSSWDRLVHGINHRWAYVMISGVLPVNERVDLRTSSTLSQLTSFAAEMVPYVQKPEVNAPKRPAT